jgi:predicted NBD/HSP70 family sugar kinase
MRTSEAKSSDGTAAHLRADEAATPGVPSLLRSINERSVLELVRRRGPLSRAQVARESGLSKPTVSQVLAALLEAGLVREVGRSTGGKGPAALLYELNGQAGSVVGIDVGRRWVRAAVADLTGAVMSRQDERARVRSAATLIEQVGSMARSVAGQAGLHWKQVTHATIGSPGVFDPDRGFVAMAPNLPGWGRHGLVEAVREELGTNVSFENDVNLAALGEQAKGQGRGVRDFVYLWVGTGIGLGLVLDGKLYRGARGAAGEIGYLPIGEVDPHDPAVRRRGSFEETASGASIVRTASGLGMRSPRDAERVFAAARRGDPAAVGAIGVEARRLALGVAVVAAVLDPELVILGGGVGRSGDLLTQTIEEELRSLSPLRPRVVVSALGDDAVLHGAVATALAAARRQLFSRSREPARPREKVSVGSGGMGP